MWAADGRHNSTKCACRVAHLPHAKFSSRRQHLFAPAARASPCALPATAWGCPLPQGTAAAPPPAASFLPRPAAEAGAAHRRLLLSRHLLHLRCHPLLPSLAALAAAALAGLPPLPAMVATRSLLRRCRAATAAAPAAPASPAAGGRQPARLPRWRLPAAECS